MKLLQIKFEELARSVVKNLEKSYLITGDEIWQQQQSVKLISDAAKERNFQINQTLHLDKDDAWQQFALKSNNTSLFSSKNLYKINLTKNKLSKQALKILEQFWSNNDENLIIIITCSKLTANEKKLSWVQKFDKNGITLHLWPLFSNQMVPWIIGRFKHYNFNADNQAVNFLANYTQNNLLAADQAIFKLSLSVNKKNITKDDLVNILFNQNKFSCFDLMDPLVHGKTDKLIEIITILQMDPQQINLITYIISQEIEEAMADNFQKKTYLGRNKINRLETLKNKYTPQNLATIIYKIRDIEKTIKGAKLDDPWHLLTNLCINIATQNKELLS